MLTSKAIDLGRRNNLESLTLEGLVASGNVHMIRNQFDEARSLYERALMVAEAYRHEEFKARIHASLASVLVRTLQPEAAAAEIRAARPYYESVTHTRNLAVLDALDGQVRIQLMDYERAIDGFRGAIDRAIAIRDSEEEVTGRENLATALAGAGRYVESLEEYRSVKRLYEAAGRTRGATFATLNIIDVLTRLGRFEEAARERHPPIDEPARELRAQKKRIESTVALRQGRFADARMAAMHSLELGDNLSATRTAYAEVTLCLASSKMGHDARAYCDAADRRTRGIGDPSLRLETCLALAEARLATSDNDGAAPFLAEASAILSNRPANEQRWRSLALSLATASVADRPAARAHLTRELEQLRLKWGESNFMSWRRRADVSSLLRSLHL